MTANSLTVNASLPNSTSMSDSKIAICCCPHHWIHESEFGTATRKYAKSFAFHSPYLPSSPLNDTGRSIPRVSVIPDVVFVPWTSNCNASNCCLANVAKFSAFCFCISAIIPCTTSIDTLIAIQQTHGSNSSATMQTWMCGCYFLEPNEDESL